MEAAALLIAARPLELTKMILVVCLPMTAPMAFVLRIHRASIALRRGFTPLMVTVLVFATWMLLAALLTIHRRTAEAITPSAWSLTLVAAASSGRIHRGGRAIRRSSHRSRRDVGWCYGVRLRSGERCGCRGSRKRRGGLFCRLGILRLQGGQTEGKRATKPG